MTHRYYVLFEPFCLSQTHTT